MKSLSKKEVSDFYALGYHRATRVMSEQQATQYRASFESFETRYPKDVIKLDQKAQMLCPWIDEMVRLPALLDPLEDLLGPDILCWGTSLRLKEADGKTFAGWHQDTAYADVRPIVIICALALSCCTKDSGCIRVLPESHKWALLPHRENIGTDSLLTREHRPSNQPSTNHRQWIWSWLQVKWHFLITPSVIRRDLTAAMIAVYFFSSRWSPPWPIRSPLGNRRRW